MILACAIVMALGTASGGMRIIQTMAFRITKIESVQGFVAETSSSIVILGASFLGMPVSSTHVIAGGITGVGTARSRSAVYWETPHRLLFALALTMPGAACISAFTYFIASFF